MSVVSVVLDVTPTATEEPTEFVACFVGVARIIFDDDAQHDERNSLIS